MEEYLPQWDAAESTEAVPEPPPPYGPDAEGACEAAPTGTVQAPGAAA
ncbi:hypothetical protein ACIO8H_34990 [Streptomyces sp. NPDC087226]